MALIQPVSTFAAFAEILGFVFLLLRIRWIVQAFLERTFNDLWWITLTSGILMTVLAFWVGGEFFLERAYTLLVFAGILGADDRHHQHCEGLPASPAGGAPVTHAGAGRHGCRLAGRRARGPRPTVRRQFNTSTSTQKERGHGTSVSGGRAPDAIKKEGE